jgi:serine/threonine protein kinase
MTYHVSASHKRNVVKLLGLGWERVIDEDLDEPSLAPVMALEYAPFETLKDLFFSSSFISSYKNKKQLLVDVADGLHALHCSGIVHGDVKPENILVFKDPKQGMIAKLSDFGLAVIDPNSGPELQQLPGGSFPYTAPEASRLIPRAELRYTNVYSFGIVVWQTFLHGTMPFYSSRYHQGQPLSKNEVQMLKIGQHFELASLYNLQLDVNGNIFSEISQGEELRQETYEPPEDLVNKLLLAMAQDSLVVMTQNHNADGDESAIRSSVSKVMELH